MKYIFPLLALFLPIVSFSQDENLVYYDYIYSPDIKSVKFHVDGLLTSMPAIELSGGATLLLSFDEMEGDAKNYVYSVVHCDANWKAFRKGRFGIMITPSRCSKIIPTTGFPCPTVTCVSRLAATTC
jgi:hypothetical protein